MNPKVVAKRYYKSIGAADEANCHRVRLAACAQLGREASLLHEAKVLDEKKALKERVEAKQKESELRSKHAGKLEIYSKCVEVTLKERRKLDKDKKP